MADQDTKFRLMLAEKGINAATSASLLSLTAPDKKQAMLDSHHQQRQSQGGRGVDLSNVLSDTGELDVHVLATRLTTCDMKWIQGFIESDTIVGLKGSPFTTCSRARVHPRRLPQPQRLQACSTCTCPGLCSRNSSMPWTLCNA